MILLFFACLPNPSATLATTITDSSGLPVANVQIEIIDLNEQTYSSTITNSDGSFQAPLPPLQTFFAILSHPDFMTTTHTGIAGEGETELSNTLIIQQQEEFQARQVEYTDCIEEGGYIEGEVRIAIPDQEIETLPIVTAARATAFDLDYQATPSCYVDPTTEPPQTGETGRYLIPNLPEGVHEVLLTVQYDAQTQREFYYLVYVPKDGIAPIFPTLIPL
jgi:hypothetical protein